MNRGRRDFGNKRNFKRREQQQFKQVDKSWQTEKRLLETEVGVDKYVNDLKGFQGVIKSRYSDFLVNEIDLNNELAIFSDFSVPKPAEAEPSNDGSLDIKIEDYIDEAKQKEVDELLKNDNVHKSVLIDVTEMDKEKRGNLHKIMRKVYGNKASSNTISTEAGKKYIQIKKFTKNDHSDLRGWHWPGDYVHFILFKENIDTIQAISMLAKNMKLRASMFSYCGTKDKRAKTSQWISVKKTDPKKIIQAARNLQGIRVGNFKFGNKALKLGELTGNRFQIALRSIDGDEGDISKACESTKENGFINYYGMQRFGNCSDIPTYEVGKALLKSDFKLAVDLILKEREGEPNYMKKMRETWSKTNNASEALKHVDHRQANLVEVRVLQTLKKQGEDKYNYLQALQSLPRNMLMLYAHSYQSLIFNKVASKRRELGLSVIEGDLVLKESSNEPLETAFDDNPEPEENEEERKEEQPLADPIVEDPAETKSKFIDMVRPLTKEDVESGKFTIFDIVLVLPGHDIQYPKGVIGDYYLELLSQDDLSPEQFKARQKILSLGGAYRKVFIKPAEFSWKFLNYENQNDDLILSDFSRMMKDPEIESKPDGKNRALILDFKLPQSGYATMLLRELLKADTSTQTQMRLQKDITGKPDEKNGESLKRKLENEVTAEGADDDDHKEKVVKTE